MNDAAGQVHVAVNEDSAVAGGRAKRRLTRDDACIRGGRTRTCTRQILRDRCRFGGKVNRHRVAVWNRCGTIWLQEELFGGGGRRGRRDLYPTLNEEASFDTACSCRCVDLVDIHALAAGRARHICNSPAVAPV